jgi:hypothetical protein
VAEDACRASALTGVDGQDWPAEVVHAISLAAMAGEYAAITTTSKAAAAATLIASRSGSWRKR